ncbi:hypothetical protein PTTW11_00003 [Pyrenophora teres f. teres]|uniref:Uncharacterized protein n=1 Tax=Pyrenophora teres f. teres TaxID=97479 RepID=A0A6S6VPZ5_9PLEO|nr:hypothetical protein PTTW11_00003 [Pyrenophora teres f. teres]
MKLTTIGLCLLGIISQAAAAPVELPTKDLYAACIKAGRIDCTPP